MTPEPKLKKALVADCGCLLYDQTTIIIYCQRHDALLNEFNQLLKLFDQELVIQIVKSHYEKDMFS